MKRTSDVTILGTVVYGVSISTTTFTLRSRTSLGSTQINNQSKASKSDRYWVMTSEKRSPTYVVYHFDTQRLSPTRVCKKNVLSNSSNCQMCYQTPATHKYVIKLQQLSSVLSNSSNSQKCYQTPATVKYVIKLQQLLNVLLNFSNWQIR